MVHTHREGRHDTVVVQCPQIHACFTPLFGWKHDREASAHEEPIVQIRQQMSTMQANLETLRTRVGQIADLRGAQALFEGQRTLTARLAEVEECSSVQTLREFTRRIMRLEAQVGGHGRVQETKS